MTHRYLAATKHTQGPVAREEKTRVIAGAFFDSGARRIADPSLREAQRQNPPWLE
jgi:hypothetical protein